MDYYPVPQQNQARQPQQPQQPARKRPRPSAARAHAPPLAPTWYGIIETTEDAIRLFEAVLSGTLMHTSRRPHDRERDGLIRSGNVFIFEESSSGIKRWTDGRNWSPSRIQGNFLIYRELGDDLPPGEKKKAIKRKREDAPEPLDGPAAANHGQADAANQVDTLTRSLLGSLIDSYNFKAGGLMKKTISIDFNGTSHHLVSYYSFEDGYNGRLSTPSRDPWLSTLLPRLALMTNQDFRNEMEQENPVLLEAATVAEMAPTPSYGYAPQQPLAQMPNNMAVQPYNTTGQFHMAVPMDQHIVPSPPHLMGHHPAHDTSGPVSWGMQTPQSMHHSYHHQLPYQTPQAVVPQQQMSPAVEFPGYGMGFDMQ
ncbi:hypothetical protein VMCG_00048 [Cytospora schulzeri]|uniref:Gti1/Pac2 family protein n=1 Tax=Cytospora schulzeri TaxID=448051 RepID=A0A423X8J5_9PEZI|nr:hypothetical protein VMCG_00048 [Valsa malicola]